MHLPGIRHNHPPTAPAPKVLIVGGGPSGLILAISLLRNGIPIRIIEKNAEPRLGQRGAGIMPRSLELFSYLRIIKPVMQKAIMTPTVRTYEMPGGVKVLHEFEMSPRRNPTPSHPFLNPVMLGQDSLERIFHAALAEYGCHVELGTELTSFEQRNGIVRAKLIRRGSDSTAANEVQEEATFDWMIGTDGARGVVRKQLGLSFLGETKNVENMIVGDIIVEGLAPNYWHIWGDATDVMISLRATETHNLFNFLVSGRNVNHTKLTSDMNALKECFVANTGRRQDLRFVEIPWMSTYTFEQRTLELMYENPRPNIRMVQSFGSDRVYVAGDAGHVHSPTGGQGMNTGIQDTFNLGWKLALVIKGLASPSLLSTYSEERIPVIAEMIAQTTKLLRKTMDNLDDGHGTGVWKSNVSLYQLGVNYRWSSIVVDERKMIEAEREAKEDEYLKDFDFDDGMDDEEGGEVQLDSYGATHDGRIRAGDRAPDSSGINLLRIKPSKPDNHGHHHHAHLQVNETCSLFDIFDNTKHTVLLFADLVNLRAAFSILDKYPRDSIRTVAIVRHQKAFPQEASHADLVMEDRDGHTREAYCPTGVCGVCIVRPDGVLGALVKGPSGIRKYFSGVFNALLLL